MMPKLWHSYNNDDDDDGDDHHDHYNDEDNVDDDDDQRLVHNSDRRTERNPTPRLLHCTPAPASHG